MRKKGRNCVPQGATNPRQRRKFKPGGKDRRETVGTEKGHVQKLLSPLEILQRNRNGFGEHWRANGIVRGKKGSIRRKGRGESGEKDEDTGPSPALGRSGEFIGKNVSEDRRDSENDH